MAFKKQYLVVAIRGQLLYNNGTSVANCGKTGQFVGSLGQTGAAGVEILKKEIGGKEGRCHVDRGI